MSATSVRRAALLCNIVCVLFWGLSFVSIKVAVAHIPPMTLGTVRFTLAIILLAALKAATEKKAAAAGRAPDRLSREDVPLLAGSGLAGVTFYFFCENNGVALVSASEASIIVAAIPVLTMLCDRIAGARLAPLQWAGAVVSIAGVALVVGVAISGSTAGYLYMAGAALCWVAYGFLTRPLFARRQNIFIVFWQNLFGFVGFIPFTTAELIRYTPPALSAGELAALAGHIAFLGIFCSGFCYWLYAYSLEKLGVSVSSVFINLIPVVTVVAGFFMLGERLRPLQWAGGILVVAGVCLTVHPRRT